ncbi:sensor domain-containing diguanylate cyclase [Azomonas macrocytogenes]|uniref:diguanylate cyclase n=1 Tax=Azomonas macrocytogenes TaxID=69962 RepID=A0A839SXU4_AZOMA|nr:GGDEF domain-containing protein [Azomonas macrocytogenes]MBB3102181.1 diguanylate cyclase (GGDEF)-like protein [Azomonas macrocytogenes]
MLLNDPVTLLFIITPFGIMTTLVLFLSYVGLGKHNVALHWWTTGDALLAAYRTVALLQPGLLGEQYAWLEVFSPEAALITGTTLLLVAIGCHTRALQHLSECVGDSVWHAKDLALPTLYAVGAILTIHTAHIFPWFTLMILVMIGLQFHATSTLKSRYRGAWGLLAGQVVLIFFHGSSLLMLSLDPPPPLPFDKPDLPSITALAMDFMVSFLFTLSFALMLQEQLRLQVLHLSITDTLTGALNRRGAFALLDKEWAQAKRQRYPLAIAMIDLDNFKKINDEHGHASGDAVLQTFSATVFQLKRQADVFVRWGGEEFLLVFPRSDTRQAQHFMERLRTALQQQSLAADLRLRITFSAGLADTFTIDSKENFESLLGAVDKALYRAKRHRDRVEVVEHADL